jgi:hypothetical protein
MTRSLLLILELFLNLIVSFVEPVLVAVVAAVVVVVVVVVTIGGGFVHQGWFPKGTSQLEYESLHSSFCGKTNCAPKSRNVTFVTRVLGSRHTKP